MESTGSETRFTNRLDTNPASRGVFAFERYEALIEWVTQPALCAVTYLAIRRRLNQLVSKSDAKTSTGAAIL
jgi:hypothetical protein